MSSWCSSSVYGLGADKVKGEDTGSIPTGKVRSFTVADFLNYSKIPLKKRNLDLKYWNQQSPTRRQLAC